MSDTLRERIEALADEWEQSNRAHIKSVALAAGFRESEIVYSPGHHATRLRAALAETAAVEPETMCLNTQVVTCWSYCILPSGHENECAPGPVTGRVNNAPVNHASIRTGKAAAWDQGWKARDLNIGRGGNIYRNDA